MIVEVSVAIDPRPIWWRSVDGPPPTPWVDVFASFTGTDTADEWGLAAAIFIAQTRRRTGTGPTFSELLLELLPDADGIPSSIAEEFDYRERRQLIGDFRIHASIEWRRRGWISWERGVERSLRVGKVFRAHSRQFQAERAARIRAREEMTGEELAREAPDPQPGDRALYGAEAAEFGARLIAEALEDDGECEGRSHHD